MVTNKSFYNESGKYFIKYLRNKPQEIKDYLKAEELFLKENILSSDSGLEIGCGTGRILKILAEKCKTVVGIDFNAQFVELAKKNVQKWNHVAVYNDNIQNFKYLNRQFDCITIMDNTLGNISGTENKIRALKSIKNHLNETGQMFVSVYSKNAKQAQENSYQRIGLTGIMHEGNITHTNEGLSSERFSKKYIEYIMKSAGLIPNVSKLTPISYICNATHKTDNIDN